MRGLRFLVLLLMVIGALNWGLVGFFEYNLIGDVVGYMGSRIIFAIVGLAGLYGISMLCCHSCGCGPSCNCHKK